MTVTRTKLQTMIRELPKTIEIEEVMYRLYLLHKIEVGETDVREGRTLSHRQAVKRLSKRWQD